MTHRPDRIKRLTSTPLEMEAGIIVAALEENGINATLTGETTAGFRAEAPGWVQVLVAEEDLPRAQTVLDDVRQHRDDVDWSTVDVGEPEVDSIPDAVPRIMSLSVWRRIAFVVVVVMAIGIFARIGAGVIGLILRELGWVR